MYIGYTFRFLVGGEHIIEYAHYVHTVQEGSYHSYGVKTWKT